MLLSGKTIIVPGASSGIGAAAARLFAAEGAKLILGARRAGLLKEITNEILAGGGEADFVAGDVEDSGFAAELVQRA
jgi:hypothetical protein